MQLDILDRLGNLYRQKRLFDKAIDGTELARLTVNDGIFIAAGIASITIPRSITLRDAVEYYHCASRTDDPTMEVEGAFRINYPTVPV